MLSYFLCQHKFCDLFQVSQEEWDESIQTYPELEEHGSCFDCDDRSANASMEPGKTKMDILTKMPF